MREPFWWRATPWIKGRRLNVSNVIRLLEEAGSEQEVAEGDLRSAVNALELGDEDCPFETVGFHAQQCAEKYLKALLMRSARKVLDLCVIQHLLPEVPAQVARRAEVNCAADKVREVELHLGHREKVGSPTLLELDQDVDVALGLEVLPQDGAEERQPPDPMFLTEPGEAGLPSGSSSRTIVLRTFMSFEELRKSRWHWARRA